jgi:hypothetical protein
MVSTIILSHGQVLIWKARDDERYMHALRFENDDLKKMRIVYSVYRSCSGGWSVEASTTLMDRMMGIQWMMRNYEKNWSERVILDQFYRGSCRSF